MYGFYLIANINNQIWLCYPILGVRMVNPSSFTHTRTLLHIYIEGMMVPCCIIIVLTRRFSFSIVIAEDSPVFPTSSGHDVLPTNTRIRFRMLYTKHIDHKYKLNLRSYYPMIHSSQLCVHSHNFSSKVVCWFYADNISHSHGSEALLSIYCTSIILEKHVCMHNTLIPCSTCRHLDGILQCYRFFKGGLHNL